MDEGVYARRSLALAASVGVVLGLGSLAAGCGSKSGSSGVGLSPASTAGGATTAPTTSASGGGVSGPVAITPAPPPSGQVIATGTLRVLTYNVAGLPQFLSGSSPATNTIIISPLLNTYDLVLAQEDFTYHGDLARLANHTYQTQPPGTWSRLMHDGLNRFSNAPFQNHQRVIWNQCHGLFSAGADCLAEKGFTVARHDLAPGVSIDVYNIHADAGGDQGDIDARISQFAQLSTFLQTYSAGNAVLVAGDTNLKGARRPRDDQTLLDFLGATGLTDSARALNGPEDIDRIMFRSTAKVILTPTLWREATEFVDANGNELSDHEANNVDIEWKLIR